MTSARDAGGGTSPTMRTLDGYLSKRAQSIDPTGLVYREDDGTYTLERGVPDPMQPTNDEINTAIIDLLAAAQAEARAQEKPKTGAALYRVRDLFSTLQEAQSASIVRVSLGPSIGRAQSALEMLKRAEAIAVPNSLLPDADPRKITRDRLDALVRAVWLEARAHFRGDDENDNPADEKEARERVERALAPLLALLPP